MSRAAKKIQDTCLISVQDSVQDALLRKNLEIQSDALESRNSEFDLLEDILLCSDEVGNAQRTPLAMAMRKTLFKTSNMNPEKVPSLTATELLIWSVFEIFDTGIHKEELVEWARHEPTVKEIFLDMEVEIRKGSRKRYEELVSKFKNSHRFCKPGSSDLDKLILDLI
jgi:hypothetical protein